MQGLIDVTSVKVASVIKGQSTEEIWRQADTVKHQVEDDDKTSTMTLGTTRPRTTTRRRR